MEGLWDNAHVLREPLMSALASVPEFRHYGFGSNDKLIVFMRGEKNDDPQIVHQRKQEVLQKLEDALKSFDLRIDLDYRVSFILMSPPSESQRALCDPRSGDIKEEIENIANNMPEVLSYGVGPGGIFRVIAKIKNEEEGIAFDKKLRESLRDYPAVKIDIQFSATDIVYQNH